MSRHDGSDGARGEGSSRAHLFPSIYFTSVCQQCLVSLRSTCDCRVATSIAASRFNHGRKANTLVRIWCISPNPRSETNSTKASNAESGGLGALAAVAVPGRELRVVTNSARTSGSPQRCRTRLGLVASLHVQRNLAAASYFVEDARKFEGR